MFFSYGRVVSGKQFYDRTAMKNRLKRFTKNAQAFMLKAPRRYGKTSLIKHVMLEENKEYLYLDFRRIPRLEIANDQIIEYAYSQMGIQGALSKIRENAIAFLREHKTTVLLKHDIFEASVEFFSNSKKTEEERLSRALELLNEAAEASGKIMYVFMDEFQDVIKLSKEHDILELMRGQMQHHEKVCYMFAGSHTTLMTKIFEGKKSPFYNFSRKLTLEPFDTKELSKELIPVFNKLECVFETEEHLHRLIERTKGHPGNTMLVMSALEEVITQDAISIIKDEHIEKAYFNAHVEMNEVIDEYIIDIKKKEHLYDVIYRIANDEPQILEPSSLLQKKKTLVEMGYLIHVDRGEYRIIDGFLEDTLKMII